MKTEYKELYAAIKHAKELDSYFSQRFLKALDNVEAASGGIDGFEEYMKPKLAEIYMAAVSGTDRQKLAALRAFELAPAIAETAWN